MSFSFGRHCASFVSVLAQKPTFHCAFTIILVILLEHQSDTQVITVKIEILLEPTSNKLMVERFDTSAGNPVKEILLKLNLPDHRSILTDSKILKDGGEDIHQDPRERSFDDYKWMFDLEIDQLADEYKLVIGKKGHMQEDIWENCRKVQGDNTYWWHDQKSEEEERQKLRINVDEYKPPMVHVETFKVKRYSFDTGQSFICVTKELMDALPMGRQNGSRFRDMIRKEVDSGRRIHRQT
ncbi:hypothetical protein Tco_1577933 [Tanacetum coccineum]